MPSPASGRHVSSNCFPSSTCERRRVAAGPRSRSLGAGSASPSPRRRAVRGAGGVPRRALARGHPRGRGRRARPRRGACGRESGGAPRGRACSSPGSGGEAFASRRSTGACSRTRSGGRPSSAPRSSARAGRASSRRESPFASSASDGRRWSSGRSSIFLGVALRRRAPCSSWSRASRAREGRTRTAGSTRRGTSAARESTSSSGRTPTGLSVAAAVSAPSPIGSARASCGRWRPHRRGSAGRSSPAWCSARTAGSRGTSATASGPPASTTSWPSRARTSPTSWRERSCSPGPSAFLAGSARPARSVAIAAYVLAVGWQPSVVRAGVAGALASLAWLASRPRDRWYFLLAGAAVLLAWNPYGLLDPGFQLSFAAVASIFVLVPRIERALDGYPVPRWVTAGLAVSLACGVATAPILLVDFGAIPLYSILANALAAPVVAPLLGLALAAATLHPFLPEAAAAIAWADGWLAAYLAFCARTVGGLPHAQATSAAAVGLVGGALALGAFFVRARAPGLRRTAVAVGVALALVVAWRSVPSGPAPPPTGLRLTVLDVGQGDAILLQVPEGAVLVDEGPPEADVAGPARGARRRPARRPRPHPSGARPRRRGRGRPRADPRRGGHRSAHPRPERGRDEGARRGPRARRARSHRAGRKRVPDRGTPPPRALARRRSARRRQPERLARSSCSPRTARWTPCSRPTPRAP